MLLVYSLINYFCQKTTFSKSEARVLVSPRVGCNVGAPAPSLPHPPISATYRSPHSRRCMGLRVGVRVTERRPPEFLSAHMRVPSTVNGVLGLPARDPEAGCHLARGRRAQGVPLSSRAQANRGVWRRMGASRKVMDTRGRPRPVVKGTPGAVPSRNITIYPPPTGLAGGRATALSRYRCVALYESCNACIPSIYSRA